MQEFFSVISALKYGYEESIKESNYFLKAISVLLCLSLVNIIALIIFEVGVFFFGILQLIVIFGILRASFALDNGEDITLSYLFLTSDLVLKLFIITIIVMLFVLIFLFSVLISLNLVIRINEFALLIPALLIVIFIYLFLRCFFMPHLIIDKDLNLISSFKNSFKLTADRTIRLFIYILLLFLVNVLITAILLASINFIFTDLYLFNSFWLTGLTLFLFSLMLLTPVISNSSLYIYQKIKT